MAISHIKYVNLIMNVIIYVPIIVLIGYFGMKFYHYIYPYGGAPVYGAPRPRGWQMWDWIKRTFMQLLIKVFGVLLNVKDFFKANYFRFFSLIFLVIYLGVTYAYTSGGYKNSLEGNYLVFANIIWALIGAFTIFSVFNLFLKGRRRENPYPQGGSTGDKASWTFWRTFFDFKIILGFTLVLALLLLIIFLLARYRIITASLASLVQICAVLGLLFLAYRWVNQHPLWLEAIEDNLLLKLLYHILFLIPCFIISSVKYLYKDLKGTPGFVWSILGVEVAIIFTYFILPILATFFYTTNFSSRDGKLTIQQATDGLDTSILTLQHSIKKIKNGLDVDWDNILQDGLYKTDQDDILNDYLTAHGFKDAVTSQKSIKTLFFGVPVTIAAAKSYIQANGSRLATQEIEVTNLIQERDNLEPKMKKSFETKQLLDKAVYTDIQRTIGSFENLIQGIHSYNYRYAVSAWVFLHEQPPNERAANNRFTSIINYGGRPNILFKASENTLQIKMKDAMNKEKIIYQTDTLPLQKWNNLVINYTGGTLDIFINGELVASISNIVPYMSYSAITVGEENGVSGGACNIIYYSNPLSKRQIDLFYNTLKNKNPPTV